MESTEKPKNCL